jgi:tripeptidyl-peptidase-1
MTGATPPSSYFNASGRAYPDITTYASNYFVFLAGEVIRESGTSASAPVFAAMVTLWNDMRIAYGLPPMGFIAPFLYSIYAEHPEAFNDIVTGNNVAILILRYLKSSHVFILLCIYRPAVLGME